MHSARNFWNSHFRYTINAKWVIFMERAVIENHRTQSQYNIEIVWIAAHSICPAKTHTTLQLFHWAFPVNIDLLIAKLHFQDTEFSRIKIISPMNTSFLTIIEQAAIASANKKAAVKMDPLQENFSLYDLSNRASCWPWDNHKITLICETKQMKNCPALKLSCFNHQCNEGNAWHANQRVFIVSKRGKLCIWKREKIALYDCANNDFI